MQKPYRVLLFLPRGGLIRIQKAAVWQQERFLCFGFSMKMLFKCFPFQIIDLHS